MAKRKKQRREKSVRVSGKTEPLEIVVSFSGPDDPEQNPSSAESTDETVKNDSRRQLPPLTFRW